ncbi:MOSC domain-containing protein [Pareuzebyella sediminis]|uniref:MOSC domain-containing protein n=1 Tax=Pareuzebyella sediminis TaxID=2607998 RepID=UPI0011EC7FFE|nr:MOSC N-terminal beta barrel domain-containing protein [Pareuzebyella sediminis]
MQITKLYTYALKSSTGLERDTVSFQRSGFIHDRSVAIINAQNKIITGREEPKLLTILSEINDQKLHLTVNSLGRYSFPLPNKDNSPIQIKLFRDSVSGQLFQEEANELISKLLKGSYSLIYIGNAYRPLLDKRGGKMGEITGYADSSPIHLINTKTLNYLNERCSNKFSDQNFRPNIVIDGVKPFEEDSWSLISINGFHFRLQERTQRCIFTTIDPETQNRDREQEPLRTIAKIRRAIGLRPTFGVNLVPLTAGSIGIGSKLEVVKKQ